MGHEDAKCEPDGRRCVSADDVTQEVNAQVNSAEPNEQDEDCEGRDGRPAREIGRGYAGEQIGQKAVSDERPH